MQVLSEVYIFCLYALFEQTYPVTTQLFSKASSLSKPIR